VHDDGNITAVIWVNDPSYGWCAFLCEISARSYLCVYTIHRFNINVHGIDFCELRFYNHFARTV